MSQVFLSPHFQIPLRETLCRNEFRKGRGDGLGVGHGKDGSSTVLLDTGPSRQTVDSRGGLVRKSRRPRPTLSGIRSLRGRHGRWRTRLLMGVLRDGPTHEETGVSVRHSLPLQQVQPRGVLGVLEALRSTKTPEKTTLTEWETDPEHTVTTKPLPSTSLPISSTSSPDPYTPPSSPTSDPIS